MRLQGAVSQLFDNKSVSLMRLVSLMVVAIVHAPDPKPHPMRGLATGPSHCHVHARRRREQGLMQDEQPLLLRVHVLLWEVRGVALMRLMMRVFTSSQVVIVMSRGGSGNRCCNCVLLVRGKNPSWRNSLRYGNISMRSSRG